jgi:hypothetical protein
MVTPRTGNRQASLSLVTAVIGSIVTAAYRSSLRLPGVPPPLVDQARASFWVAIHAGGSTGAGARDAFVHGIHIGLLYAAGAALLAAASVGPYCSNALRRSADSSASSRDRARMRYSGRRPSPCRRRIKRAGLQRLFPAPREISSGHDCLVFCT